MLVESEFRSFHSGQRKRRKQTLVCWEFTQRIMERAVIKRHWVKEKAE